MRWTFWLPLWTMVILASKWTHANCKNITLGTARGKLAKTVTKKISCFKLSQKPTWKRLQTWISQRNSDLIRRHSSRLFSKLKSTRKTTITRARSQTKRFLSTTTSGTFQDSTFWTTWGIRALVGPATQSASSSLSTLVSNSSMERRLKTYRLNKCSTATSWWKDAQVVGLIWMPTSLSMPTW